MSLFKRVASRGAIVEPGHFQPIGSHIVFVEERSRDGRLSGVMLYDTARDERPFQVFAARGRMRFEESERAIALELFDGEVHLEPSAEDPERYERVRFESLAYRLDVGHLLGMDFWPVRPKQMTVTELRDVLERVARDDELIELDEKNPRAYQLEIHRRHAQPIAPLLFAAVGVPLALASEHRGRNAGLLWVLGTAFAYYALGAVATEAAESGRLAPGLSQWIPNLALAGLAAALIGLGRDRIPA